jgi:hypothetical protein
MANDFRSGTAGDVYVAGHLVAGIYTWKLDQQTAPVPIPNFQSPIDGLNRVWPQNLFGLTTATGSFEGYFNVDPTDVTDGTTTSITTGIGVKLDLILSKGALWGYEVTAILTSFSTTVNVNNQPNSFTCNFTVSGIVPRSAVVTP